MKLVVISQIFTRVKYQEIIWPLYRPDRHLTEEWRHDLQRKQVTVTLRSNSFKGCRTGCVLATKKKKIVHLDITRKDGEISFSTRLIALRACKDLQVL